MSKQNFDKFINKKVKGAKKKEQLKQEKKISKKEREAYFIEKKRQMRAEKKQQAPPPFVKDSKPQWEQKEKRSFDKPAENKWSKDKGTKKYPVKKDNGYPQKDSGPDKFSHNKKPVNARTSKPFPGKTASEGDNKKFAPRKDYKPSSFKEEKKTFDKRPSNKPYKQEEPYERKPAPFSRQVEGENKKFTPKKDHSPSSFKEEKKTFDKRVPNKPSEREKSYEKEPFQKAVPGEVKKPSSNPKQVDGDRKKFTPARDWKSPSHPGDKKHFEQRPEKRPNDPGLPYARKPIQKIIDPQSFQKPAREKLPMVVKKPAPSISSMPGNVEEEIMPLNKYIAHGGICSRRDAGELVKAGKVKVNGKVITEPGYKVQEEDVVIANGKRVVRQVNLVYILLNKPKDYITTAEDPQGRKTVLDIVRSATTERIYPVGRLDRNTSGVLLLTNDGGLAQHLTHPSFEVRKIYEAKLDKPLSKIDFEKLLNGVTLEDGEVRADSVAYADTKDKSIIGIEIHSGRNRVVRRMFEHLGYDVKALDRVMFANLTKKNVERGKWRFLNDKEVRLLKFFNKSKA